MSFIPHREAFRTARLTELVSASQAAVERARAAFQAARGPAKAVARRELKRAQTLLTRAEHGLKNEQQGEVGGPAVQRQTIVDRDVILREPRIVTHGKSVALVSALDRMLSRGSLDLAQHAAGKRYREAHEKAGMDAYPIGLGEGIGGTPCSGNRRVEEAVGSSQELSRLRSFLSSHEISLVEHVVLHDLHLESWGIERCLNRHNVMGFLKAALWRLAEKA